MTNTPNTGGADSAPPSALLALLDDPIFPASDRERWKYTNPAPLRELIREGLGGVTNSGDDTDLSASVSGRLAALGVLPAEALIFSNGHWQQPRAISTPLTFCQGSETANFDTRVAQSELNKLNAGAPEQSLRVRLTQNPSESIALNIVYGLSSTASLYNPQIDIALAKGQHLVVTEYFIDSGERNDYFCNYAARFSLADNARLTHTRVNLLGDSAHFVCDTKIQLAASAHAESLSVDLGAQLARNEISCVMDGAGSHVRTAGIALGHAKRQIDHIVTMHHLAGDATSEQDYVAVLADRSTSVFKGKVHVAEGADGTDSKQSSRNLLLSDKAIVNTMPELEIYADDVKCAHGATTGQLDEAALFYLCSRGIPESKARDLLIRAFADKTLTPLSDLTLRTQLSGLIGETLNSLLSKGATA